MTTMQRPVTIILLWGLFCAVLSSCHRQYPHALTAADSLADATPDSAWQLLLSLDTTSLSQREQMYRRLLLYKTADGLDRLTATVDDAEQLVGYYETDGDPSLLPQAYYYGGRICAERSNAPQALSYFRKAEALLQGGPHLSLLSKVYSQMGYLFVDRRMYGEARACAEKSYECDKAINDTVGMIYNLRDIGVSYKWADREKEALPYFYQAKELADMTQNEFMRTSAGLELAATYLDMNELDSVRKYVFPLLLTIAQTDSSAVYSVIAEFYHQSNRADSAEYYSQMLLKHGRKVAQCRAHQILTEINIKKSRPTEALRHYREHQELKYRIDKENSTEEIAQANSAYNYQQKEAENYELKAANSRQELLLAVLVGGILVIALVFLLFFNRYRHRQSAKLKELERIRNEQFRQSEHFIAQSKLRIAELETALQNADTANMGLQQQLENEKRKLNASLEMAILKERESKRSLQVIKDSEAYRHILQMTRNGVPQNITADDWQELDAVVNREHEGFTRRLYELCGRMSELEHHVCLLLKADTDLVLVAEILIKAQPTISTVRSRLYQKAFGRKGSAKDWDAVIQTL